MCTDLCLVTVTPSVITDRQYITKYQRYFTLEPALRPHTVKFNNDMHIYKQIVCL